MGLITLTAYLEGQQELDGQCSYVSLSQVHLAIS